MARPLAYIHCHILAPRMGTFCRIDQCLPTGGAGIAIKIFNLANVADDALKITGTMSPVRGLAVRHHYGGSVGTHSQVSGGEYSIFNRG
eukprot:scaffold3140_cov24-Cyclotella_meneghiniana.AAC.3